MPGLDEILDEQEPLAAPAIDPIDRAIATLQSGNELRAKRSLLQTGDRDPDQVAEARRLSGKFGVPPAVIERSLTEYQQRETADRPYGDMSRQTPALTAWLETPDNAAVAKDDLEQLGFLEWIVTAPQRSFAQGVNQIRLAQLRSKQLRGEELSQFERDLIETTKLGMRDGGELGAANSWFRGAITGSSNLLAMVIGGAESAAKYATAIGAGGAAAGSIGGLPGAAAGLTAGASVGAVYGAFQFGFDLEAGLAYDELLDFKDAMGRTIDPDAARMGALAAGAINAGLEVVQLGALARTIPGFAKLKGALTRSAIKQALRQPTVAAALASAGKTYARTLTTEATTEAAQRAVTVLSAELAKVASGPDIDRRTFGEIAGEAGTEFVGALQAFALLPLPGVTMQVAGDVQAAARAAHNAQLFTVLGEGVAQSKTVQRMPAAAQAFLEEATKDGPIPRVFAPIESWTQYWQDKGIDPGEMATEVVGRADAYERAVESNSDLEIPTAAYAVKLAGTEHNAFFSQELRLHEGEMNAREAAVFAEQQQRVMTAAVPATEERAEQHAALVEQLVTTAKVPRATAERYAQLFEQFEALGERADVDLGYTLEVGREGFQRPARSPAAVLERPAAAPAGPPGEAVEARGPVAGGPTIELLEEGGLEAGASGESAASLEAIRRGEGMAARAERFVVYDRAGRRRELIGPEAVDYQPVAGELYGVEGPGGFRLLEDRGGKRPARVDIAAAAAETTEREPSPEGARPEDGEERRITIGRIDESTPLSRRESASARETRRRQHYASVFNEIRQAAKQVDPAVDVKVLRKEFNDRVEMVEQLDEDWQASGHNPRVVLQAIAEAGGISIDFETKTGGLGGELRWLKESTAFGPFGSFAGVRGVFRTREVGRPGIKSAGRSLDDMVGLLTQDTRFSYIEDISDLFQVLEDVARLAEPLPRTVNFPGTEELRRRAGVDPRVDWWKPAEERQFFQDLFEEAEAPALNVLETGEAQPRLPGAVGAVREEERPTPGLEAPFRLTAEVARQRAKQTTLFQPAYHGSPHLFERFSLHAIGTGEGVQGYGWGLYFASQRETAEFYRDNIQPTGRPFKTATLNGISYPAGTMIGNALYESKKKGINATIAELRKSIRFNESYAPTMAALHQSVLDLVLNIENTDLITIEGEGRVYKVEIPEDEDYLDWDKPASHQSPKVQAALRALGFTWEPVQVPSRKRALQMFHSKRAAQFAAEDIGIRDTLREGLFYLHQAEVKKPEAAAIDDAKFARWYHDHSYFLTGKATTDPIGRKLYEDLQQRQTQARTGDIRTELTAVARAASEALALHGVAGIKYLDGLSRATGEGSNNYVVFDDRLVEIKEFFQAFFHGTPHKFERFSLEHVGTGEGAAAYGWGLYFTENPAVAAEDFDRLAGDPQIRRMKLGTMTIGPFNDYDYGRRVHENTLENIRGSLAEELLSDMIDLLAVGAGGFRDFVLTRVDRRIDQYRTEWPEGVAPAQQLRAELAKPGALRIEWDSRPGGIYQVEIPDAAIAKMIDWDAGLEAQTDAVKAVVREQLTRLKYLRPTDKGPRQLKSALKAYLNEHGRMDDKIDGAMIYNMVVKAEEATLVGAAIEERKVLDARYPATGSMVVSRFPDTEEGQAAFKEFTRLTGLIERGRERASQAASRVLAQRGIPGVKYFDQFSRQEGQGTRNLVVFDDAIVEVTHFDGTPVSKKERDEFFQDTEASQPKRGSIRFGPDRHFNINLFANADLSTFLHESGHLFLEVFGDVADRLRATDPATLTASQRKVLADYEAALAFLGVERREQIGTEHHEKWARAFETYLFEGQAPSIELRSAFASFRAWLIGVYRTVKSLNVELTDEVRGVFDRLLATDDAIEAARAQAQIAPIFLTREAAGMSEVQFELYRTTIADASLQAQERLQAKILAEVRREQKAEWTRRREEIKVDVQADIYNRPVYLALAAIQRGTYPDGTPLEGVGADPTPQKLSRAAIVDQFGVARLGALPKPFVYTRTGGLSPEAAAAMFGFSSGDELLRALADARPMREVINEETDRRMIEEQGSLLLDGTLMEKATAALAGDGRDSIIRVELRALAELRRTVAPHVRQALTTAQRERDYERRWFEAEAKLTAAIAEGRQQVEIDALQDEVDNLKRKAAGGPGTIAAAIPPDSFIRDRARSSVARTRIRDIRPGLYWTAARKASKAATDNAARQDFEAAILGKQQELLNLALFREASAALEDAEARAKAARDLARVSTQKRLGLVDQTFLDQVNALLARYEFADIGAAAVDERVSLRKWVAALEAEGLPVDIPEAVLDDTRRLNYRELSYEELVGVTDALNHIAHLAGVANRQQATEKSRQFAERRDALSASIYALNKTKGLPVEFDASAERRRGIIDWYASHAKIATLARALDGHKDGGALWEALIRPINAAANAEQVQSRQTMKDYRAILNRYYPGAELGRLKEKLRVEAVNTSLSKEARLSVALNWGNETSRQRLLNDPRRRWSRAQIEAILDTLDRRDWDFVQATWDHIDTFWSAIAAKQERVVGIAPEKVEASAVVTRFGVMRGGYYPLKYDGRLNIRASWNEAASEAKLATAAAYVRSTTKRGHVEARQQNVKMSVRLDLGVIGEHLQQVIHDLTHHEMLLDATRLLRDGKVSNAILETRGDVVYQQFTRALQDIAIGHAVPRNRMDKAAVFMRTGTQVALLGWNLWTGAQQPLGIFNGMSRIGPVWVARGMKRWLRDAATMQNTLTWISEVSPFMRERGSTATQDIAELRLAFQRSGGWFDTLVRRVSGDALTQQHVLDSFLWHIALMQRVADVPTWLGGYEKAMAEGNDEARAYALADQAVIDSQGTGQIKDLSQIQRGGPVAKLFMTFYTYGATVFNETTDRFGGTDFRSLSSITALLGHLSLLYLAPAMATVALANAFGRREDEEAEDWVMAIGAEMLSTALNTMVLLRELTGLLNDGVRGYAGPAGARTLELVFRLGNQIKQGEADEALLRAINQVGGVVFRYPAAQVERSIDGLIAVEEGKTNSPLALFFGPPREKSR